MSEFGLRKYRGQHADELAAALVLTNSFYDLPD